MDLTKLTTSDKVIGVSAVALLVMSFLPWFAYAKEFSDDGWHFPVFGVIPLLLGLAMFAGVITAVFVTKLRDLPLSWAAANLVAGSVAALLILCKVLIGDRSNIVIGTIDLSRKSGIYLSLLAAVGLAVGGLLKTRECRAERRTLDS
ncbi:MAG: hypothetical protein ACLPVY_08670 [Acidimicrobiia bacterium]